MSLTTVARALRLDMAWNRSSPTAKWAAFSGKQSRSCEAGITIRRCCWSPHGLRRSLHKTREFNSRLRNLRPLRRNRRSRRAEECRPAESFSSLLSYSSFSSLRFAAYFSGSFFLECPAVEEGREVAEVGAAEVLAAGVVSAAGVVL